MAVQLILSLLADDRPGLVDTLSQAVTQSGGNWLESRMAHMAEKFAGIIRVDLPDAERAEALKARLAALAAEGIHVTVAEARETAGPMGAGLAVDVVGPDHPGIVQDIAHCLAAHGVSIEVMDTHTSDAPMGGGVLFHAHIEVRGPADLDEDALHGELEQLANALMVDLDLHDLGAGGGGKD